MNKKIIELAGLGLDTALGVPIFTAIKTIMGDEENKTVSSLETQRIGKVIEEIKRYADENQNYQARDDGFFDQSPNGQASFANEIFEGVLQKAKHSYEEKKVPYLAKLFLSIAKDESCNRLEANKILRTFENLTYTDLVLLALTLKNENNSFSLRNTQLVNLDEDNSQNQNREIILFAKSFCELHNYHSLINRKSNGGILRMHGTMLMLHDIIPSNIFLTYEGKRFCELVDLDSMPDDEINKVANLLK